MSGTSMDSVDVAICKITGTGNGASISLLHSYEHPLPQRLRAMLLSIHTATSIQGIAELHAKIGDLFGEALVVATEEFRALGGSSPDCAGSHGQTVYHFSGKENAFRCTLQLGDSDRIAVKAGIPVFADFRAKDMAVGGEGAPLAPYIDLLLFRSCLSIKGNVVVLNLGGIANITILPGDGGPIKGFDTGPANGPLDRLVRKITDGHEQFDRNGERARAGQTNERLLQDLLSCDTFMRKPLPKSTGFEMYGEAFVERCVALHGEADNNLVATLTEYVVESIAYALRHFVPTPILEVIVVGGGTRNGYLLERLSLKIAPIIVVPSEDRGVDSKRREAMAWALFANECLCGTPANLPEVTGAHNQVVLGKLSLPW
jgi:anhydro-N-acetylmuramic acid kinase